MLFSRCYALVSYVILTFLIFSGTYTLSLYASDIDSTVWETESLLACDADAGTLKPGNANVCLEYLGETFFKALHEQPPVVPDGFTLLYLLSKGDSLIFQKVNTQPVFGITDTGYYSIHTLIYDPEEFDERVLAAHLIRQEKVFVEGILDYIRDNEQCADLDSMGTSRYIDICPCTEDPGTLIPLPFDCFPGATPVPIQAAHTILPSAPASFEVKYLRTRGADMVIEDIADSPDFLVAQTGLTTIRTYVYQPHPTVLDFNDEIILGQTKVSDIQNFTDTTVLCATVDLVGANFDIEACPCQADAGSLRLGNTPGCIENGNEIFIKALQEIPNNVPPGYNLRYILTEGVEEVIQKISTIPDFGIKEVGKYRIHALVYPTDTLDINVLQVGQSTFDDVVDFVEGVCADLDVPGVAFNIVSCQCQADAGILQPLPLSPECYNDTLPVLLEASHSFAPLAPAGYSTIYALSSGENQVLLEVSDEPLFNVSATGKFSIHTLVADTAGVNGFDVTNFPLTVATAADVANFIRLNALCASFDSTGAMFDVPECEICTADAGTLQPLTQVPDCYDNFTPVRIEAETLLPPVIPDGFVLQYLLVSQPDLILFGLEDQPVFEVQDTGAFTIHPLVYDPLTVDLSSVVFGQTTAPEIALLLEDQTFCADLNLEGAAFLIPPCPCSANVGTMELLPPTPDCWDNLLAVPLEAQHLLPPVIPSDDFELVYLFTTGEELILQQISQQPNFIVLDTGTFAIHPLVYDSTNFDLSTLLLGQSTIADLVEALDQSGVCADIDSAGLSMMIEECPCTANIGTLELLPPTPDCWDNFVPVALEAQTLLPPQIPSDDYELVYLLSAGQNLVLQQIQSQPDFAISDTGTFAIHPLVYDSTNFDLGTLLLGQSTIAELMAAMNQAGICADIDSAGLSTMIPECPCAADIGTMQLLPPTPDCWDNFVPVPLMLEELTPPVIPSVDYELVYLLSMGQGLVVQQIQPQPDFAISDTGTFAIHPLVYDSTNFDLGTLILGQSTIAELMAAMNQAGICADIDSAGLSTLIPECPCAADIGTMQLLPPTPDCWDNFVPVPLMLDRS